MQSGSKDPSPLLQNRFLSPEAKILVPLDDLKVKYDVSSDFDWKTDYTTYPLSNSTKLSVVDFVENTLISDINAPNTDLPNLTVGGGVGF